MTLVTWHAVLAPLGELSLDDRRLKRDSEWSLPTTVGGKPAYVPLLVKIGDRKTQFFTGEREGAWAPVGRVLTVGTGHGLLVATGVVATRTDLEDSKPVDLMRDGRLRPEFDVENVTSQLVRVGADDQSTPDENVELLLHGGTVSVVYAGTRPAWDDDRVRFTVSDS